MSKEERRKKVQYWTKLLKEGELYKEKFSSKKMWKDYREYYRGNWSNDIIPVNRIFSHGKALIPRIYFRTPAVTVTATRPEYEWHARVVEFVDNYLIRELNLKKAMKQCILSTYLTGTGVIKLGYDSEFGFIPRQAVTEDTETVTQVGRQTGSKIEYRVNVKPGMPWAINVLPDDIITPYGYRDFEAFPWIAHKILRPLEDVKEDQKYKNTKDLKGGYIFSSLEDKAKIERGEEAKFALLYEIRDVKNRRIIVICENEVLLDEDDALQIEGLPYEFLIFNEDPEHFWGISDVTMVKAQQLELNEIRTQAHKHRKLSAIKFLVQKGVIKLTELDKLLSSDVGPAVEVETDAINQAVQVLQPHIPPDLTTEAQNVLADIRETLGLSRNQLGEATPQHGKTAYETAVVQQAVEMRTDEKRDAAADLLVNIIRKWNQYIFKYWTDERVARIVGPDGREAWIKYTGEELKAEYTIRVDADSGIPVTKDLRQQQALKLFTLLQNHPLINQTQLIKTFLRQFEWIDPTTPYLLGSPEAVGSPEASPVLSLQEIAKRGAPPSSEGVRTDYAHLFI